MLYEVLPDPRVLRPEAETAPQTLHIHRLIPERVPVGRFGDRGDEIVDEVTSRDEYLDRIQQACAEYGAALEIRFYDHFDEAFDASVLGRLDQIRNLTISVRSILNAEAVGRLPKLSTLHFTPPYNLKKPKILGAFSAASAAASC
jgi:hypothetical protein